MHALSRKGWRRTNINQESLSGRGRELPALIHHKKQLKGLWKRKKFQRNSGVKQERAGIKPWWVSHPLQPSGQDQELSVLSPDIKNRIIWEVQDGFPPQDPLDCLTGALHPPKLINQLTQACSAN